MRNTYFARLLLIVISDLSDSVVKSRAFRSKITDEFPKLNLYSELTSLGTVVSFCDLFRKVCDTTTNHLVDSDKLTFHYFIWIWL